MLKIYIKTYNNFLFKNLIQYINITTTNKKIAINHIVLPSKCKSFTVKKSPHVFGRSKEKYYLKTYLGVITLTYTRKKDLLNILNDLKVFTNKGCSGLGIKFVVSS